MKGDKLTDALNLQPAQGESLFGLNITTYPELEESKREIELLDKLYGLYVNVVQTIR